MVAVKGGWGVPADRITPEKLRTWPRGQALLGLTPWFKPGFVKKDLGFAEKISEMVQGIRRSGSGGPE